jgi:putative transposase
MNFRRHSPEEVTSKLHRAEEMAQHGKRQAEIARVLGISVMTYHRWRAAARAAVQAPSIAAEMAHLVDGPEVSQRNGRSSQDDLRAENTRLRQLVVDLLLEKMRLEEGLEGRRHW